MDPADDSSDDDALLEGERYQGVRDLFRYARAHGFDEEPPARIDAILMAAAREHAESKVGTFERVRRWLVATMMQPAVAGAVAIAVIGGTAGVLYMKGKGSVSEPTVKSGGSRSSSSTPPTAPMPPTHEGKDPGLDLQEAEIRQAQMAADAEKAELQAKLRQLEEVRQRESERMGRPKGDGTARVGGGGGGGRGGGDDGFVGGEGGAGHVADPLADRTVDYKPDGRDTTTIVRTEQPKPPGAGSGSGVVVVGGVTTKITGQTGGTTESPPPDTGSGTGATDEEVLKNVGSTPETTSARGDKTPPPSKRAQAENLHKQARTAAKRKDCNTVKVMAKRAKQLDAVYYRDTFAKDGAVKNCL